MKRMVAFFVLAFLVTFSAGARQVFDYEGVLDEGQIALLEETLENVSDTYEVGAYIVTEAQVSGGNPERAASDYLEQIEANDVINRMQILLYVSTYERVYYILADDILNDSAFDDIENAILPYLKEDDWNGAFVAYADKIDYLFSTTEEPWQDALASGSLTDSETGDDYWDEYEYENTRGMQNDPVNLLLVVGCVIGLPLILAFVLTGVRLSQMNTATGKNNADGFVKHGSMNLSESKDIFLYSNLVRTKKPEPENHSSPSARSGGGSFRPSSGGHSGRGGSF